MEWVVNCTVSKVSLNLRSLRAFSQTLTEPSMMAITAPTPRHRLIEVVNPVYAQIVTRGKPLDLSW